jgi:hypothetical protein
MCLALLVIYAIFALIHYVVLGGAGKVTLKAEPPLAGQIDQVLDKNSDGSLKNEGKDFSLRSQYFENKRWAVVNITALHNNFQSGFAVVKENNGIYQVVAGPGTSLASTQLQVFPNDVAAYLTTHFSIYTPIPGQTND